MSWKKIVSSEVGEMDHSDHHNDHFSEGVLLDTERLDHVPLATDVGFGGTNGYEAIRHTDARHKDILDGYKELLKRSAERGDYTTIVSILSSAAFTHAKQHSESPESFDHDHNSPERAREVLQRRDALDRHMSEIRDAMAREKSETTPTETQ